MASEKGPSGSQLVLFTLAAGQFLMTLDSSVMNVSIEEVAKDVGTTVTGIQTAITLYTLVMAALMITGAKIGAMIGRKRAFAIGCVIYGCGSFTTAIAPNYAVLLFGWSFLEGVGACSDPACDRGPCRRKLRGREATRRLRARRRRGCDRGGRRSADRRLLHHVLLVALGVCRRGGDRGDHPPAHPEDHRRTGGEAPAPGRGRRRALRRRTRAVCLRRAQDRHLGVDLPEGGWAVMGRPLPEHLDDDRRAVRAVALLRVAAPARGQRPGAARSSSIAPEQPAGRGSGDVLLPVHDPGRNLLRRPALPLGCPRSVGDRNRREAAAAVGHIARRGRRDPKLWPKASPRSSSAPGCSPFSSALWCCSAGSTPIRVPRSSSSRCSWSASGSARSRPSSAP